MAIGKRLLIILLSLIILLGIILFYLTITDYNPDNVEVVAIIKYN